MRAVVQRVLSAGVSVDGEAVGRIGRGLLVYLGVSRDDGQVDAEWMAHKIRHLRVFPDDAGKMNRDVAEVGGQLLVVSNFTLMGDARKGRRPEYTAAAEPAAANDLYEKTCELMAGQGLSVAKGRFREMMKVESVNDGPINVLLDSRRAF